MGLCKGNFPVDAKAAGPEWVEQCFSWGGVVDINWLPRRILQ
jgi:hypothetical protein